MEVPGSKIAPFREEKVNNCAEQLNPGVPYTEVEMSISQLRSFGSYTYTTYQHGTLAVYPPYPGYLRLLNI
jgi:hypothetical protein